MDSNCSLRGCAPLTKWKCAGLGGQPKAGREDALCPPARDLGGQSNGSTRTLIASTASLGSANLGTSCPDHARIHAHGYDVKKVNVSNFDNSDRRFKAKLALFPALDCVSELSKFETFTFVTS